MITIHDIIIFIALHFINVDFTINSDITFLLPTPLRHNVTLEPVVSLYFFRRYVLSGVCLDDLETRWQHTSTQHC